MNKYTDMQIKKVYFDYVETQNYTETARRNNMVLNTAKKIVKNGEKEVLRMLKEHKEQNTKDILKYMENKSHVVCEILDNFLKALTDKEKIDRANIQQIATSMAIVIDKFTKENVQVNGNVDEHNQLIEAINKLPQMSDESA